MSLTVASQPAATDFFYEVYAGTRRDEVAAWGWGTAEQEAFLRLQFDLQQRAYSLQYPGADHGVILHDGRPVGRLIVDRTGSEMHLIDLALLPAHRNAGLGAVLIRLLQAEAAEKARPIRLQVMKGNPARRLYERLGFGLAGESETHVALVWRPEGPG
ncbi:MAG: GNAT family N-acetyltransferase [Bacillota bacterium]